MSILTELRAALGALEDARHADRHSPDDWTRPRVIQARSVLAALLTDDTIRALLDVAEAEYCENIASCVDRDFAGQDEMWCDIAQCRAFAPLVKEADDGKDAMRQVR